MKRKIINRKGEEIEVDLDDGVVPEGHGIRVSSFLMDGDSVQQAIASSRSRVTDAMNLTDGLGRPVGNRPGHVYARDSAGEAAARQAHSEMCKRNESAWRGSNTISDAANSMWPSGWQGPGAYAKPKDMTLPSSSARNAYIEQLQSAWRTGGTGPASDLSARLPENEWKDRVPKELPKDRTMDARDAQHVRDAAWTNLVRRTSEAWKTPAGAPR